MPKIHLEHHISYYCYQYRNQFANQTLYQIALRIHALSNVPCTSP